jgi:hypothetical protein
MKLDKTTIVIFIMGCATLTLIAFTFFPNNILQVFSGSAIPFLLDPFLDVPQGGEKVNE